MMNLDQEPTIDPINDWEVLSNSSMMSYSSSASLASYEQVEFADLSTPLSFKDALLRSVGATGGFNLQVKKERDRKVVLQKKTHSLLPVSPTTSVKLQNEKRAAQLGGENDSNWGFSQWSLAKQPLSHARDMSERKKKGGAPRLHFFRA